MPTRTIATHCVVELPSISFFLFRGGGRSFVMVRPKGEGMGHPEGGPQMGVRGPPRENF